MRKILFLLALLTSATMWAQNPASIGSISYNSTLGAYEIKSVDNLNDLAVYVNGEGTYSTSVTETTAHDCTGLTFKMTAPIAYDYSNEWNVESTENNYTAIGGYHNNARRKFCGTFDGQGNTIFGIRIYKRRANIYAGTDEDPYSYQGVFGIIGECAIIRNVHIRNMRITCQHYAGGIVGCIADGSDSQKKAVITNCIVYNNVAIHGYRELSSSSFHGGIAGYLEYGIIEECTSSVTLTTEDKSNNTPDSFGGIVGRNQAHSTLRNNVAIGVTITLPNSSTNYGVISGYNNGTLSGNYYKDCTLTVNGTTYTAGVGCCGSDADGAKSVHTLILGNNVSASGSETTVIGGKTCYVVGSTVTLAYTSSVPAGYSALSGFNVKDASANEVTVTQSGDQYTFSMPAADATVKPIFAVIDWETESDGSSSTPYMIYNCDQLNLLATRVNSGNSYGGKNFKLGADITYEHTTDWDDATSTENNYTPIGGYLSQTNVSDFSANFDGDGHTISGIRIYRSGDVYFSDGYVGLIGKAHSSSIKNVILADTRITGSDGIGGIVASLYNSHVTNCHVRDNVVIHAIRYLTDSHGGIAGNADYNSSISGCTSAAKITYSGTASGDRCGGIAGTIARNSTISDCLVQGAAIPNLEKCGAIVGSTDCTLSNNYYYSSTVGSKTDNIGCNHADVTTNNGAVKAFTTTMPHVNIGSATTNYGLIKAYEYGLYYDGLYYMIPATVSLNDNAENDMAAINGYWADVTLADRTLTKDGNWNTICLPFDVTIANSPLVGATVKKLNTSTTNLTSGTLTLNFEDEPTTMTAGIPYIIKWDADLIINSASDWNDFATAVEGGNTFAGKVVRLNADITVSTMVGTSTNNFSGIFDGNGHTLTLDNLSANSEFCAPFRYVDGASIFSLHTDGNVIAGSNTKDDKYRTGLVGQATGITTISNCWSSVNIASELSGDGTHGGFVGVSNGSGTTTISNCLFDGSITGSNTNSCGGFVGWRNNTLNISNCLYAPTLPEGRSMVSTSGSATFSRNGVTPTNSYYTETLGDEQGSSTSGMSNAELLTALGSGWQLKGGKVVPTKIPASISNIVFTDVTISSTTPTEVKSDDQNVIFVGQYSPFTIDANNRDEILFVGAGSKIGYSKNPRALKAFRAHFWVQPTTDGVRSINIDWGEGETTMINNITTVLSDYKGTVYNILGQRVNANHKGLVIVNGKKIVNK